MFFNNLFRYLLLVFQRDGCNFFRPPTLPLYHSGCTQLMQFFPFHFKLSLRKLHMLRNFVTTRRINFVVKL